MQYSILYVVVFSIASILIQKMYFTISPFFSLFITASIATVFFNLVNIKVLKTVYTKCWQYKYLWIAIMITILVMWSCSMIAPGLIGASLYNFLYFAWLGVLGFLSLGLFRFDKLRLSWGGSILLLIAIVLWGEFHSHLTDKTLLGIALGFIGGTSAFVYFKQSQAIFQKIKLSATQIIAVRFYLTIILLFLILPKGSFSLYVTWHNMLQLTLLAALSLIIPLYFQQKALEKISSEQNAIIMSLSPTIIAILQETFFHDVKLYHVIIYLLYAVIILCSYLVKSNKEKELSA